MPSLNHLLIMFLSMHCLLHLLKNRLNIQLGGDGTVLYASWLFQRVVPPVASFSLGSLGFLTPFDFSSFEHTLGTPPQPTPLTLGTPPSGRP